MNSCNEYKFRRSTGGTLLIACGALAREIIQIVEHNRMHDVDVQCISAHLHHRPELIPDAIDRTLEQSKGSYKKSYVIYGDCGTAGGIDKVLEKHGVERIQGPHCFSFFDGNDSFMKNEDDITSFFLTDFFCQNFDKFVFDYYGLNAGQHMVDLVFGNYEKVVYIAQIENESLKAKAIEIANRLGLNFEYRYRGYSDLGVFIENIQ